MGGQCCPRNQHNFLSAGPMLSFIKILRQSNDESEVCLVSKDAAPEGPCSVDTVECECWSPPATLFLEMQTGWLFGAKPSSSLSSFPNA